MDRNLADYWADHIRRPVDFAGSIAALAGLNPGLRFAGKRLGGKPDHKLAGGVVETLFPAPNSRCAPEKTPAGGELEDGLAASTMLEDRDVLLTL